MISDGKCFDREVGYIGFRPIGPTVKTDIKTTRVAIVSCGDDTSAAEEIIKQLQTIDNVTIEVFDDVKTAAESGADILAGKGGTLVRSEKGHEAIVNNKIKSIIVVDEPPDFSKISDLKESFNDLMCEPSTFVKLKGKNSWKSTDTYHR